MFIAPYRTSCKQLHTNENLKNMSQIGDSKLNNIVIMKMHYVI